MSEVLAAYKWPTNGHMIADVARLGYLEGHVLDATFGEGTFWREWFPEHLTTNDLHKDADYDFDYTRFPWSDSKFDSVVFDPPYKLNGTPALGDQDDRYGTNRRTSREEVMADIHRGAVECFRVCRKFLLVKCQDQVEGGKVRWQTDLVTAAIAERNGRKVDRFDFLYDQRPQPGNRVQRTARRNYSTLLVFAKPKAAS